MNLLLNLPSWELYEFVKKGYKKARLCNYSINNQHHNYQMDEIKTETFILDFKSTASLSHLGRKGNKRTIINL